MKGFLRKLKPEKIKVSGATRRKIEEFHNVPIAEVYSNLRSPKNLFDVESQKSRRKNDETYILYFRLTKRKKLKIVVTYKRLKKILYIVTSHYMTKKTDKLVKAVKPRRVRG